MVRRAYLTGGIMRQDAVYTFHCTGLDAYSLLRDELGDRLQYLYTGASVEV